MEQHRLEKCNKLREMGLNPYVNSHIITSTIANILEKYSSSETELPESEEFSAAGRILAKREFGKTAFLTIRDRSGIIQVYIKKALLSEEEFEVYTLTDIGDFIGVKGTLFRTKTGELTIRAFHYRLLTKTLRDLPEKFHGLKDVETRYRQRYLDLIVNNDVKEVFIKRSQIIKEIRDFFTSCGFVEVETPMMHSLVGGAAAKPFITHHNALDMQLYLRIAPELYLKRLVVGGIERVFELNRNFRNEGVDTKHNPEFTMIEWYMAYADYHTLMDMIEELVTTISQKINNTLQIQFGDLNIDLQRPWARLTMAEAIEKYGNISQDEIADYEKAKAAAEKLHIQVDSSWGHGKIISEIFEITAEEKLINPAFIIDYPKEISPLSKSKESNPELTDRFELFIAGMELSNGFNELNDPVDQEERFQKQVDSRNAGDEEACMMDEDYIRALEYGLPPTAGAGMGIDRLVMLLTNQVSIRDVLLFPYMRSED
ncbi:lysine--tRNA ligase [Mucispirillum schaedleri]|jgi:lysyl-tRNA synthetase class 2|uniref:Lysine--tRNA ligase n=1 Tax=Mucispirillum schaedleri ASF457 TaxID=1379858 RepID=V2Q962_9BACT|nr:lysine--tRNA ligase [Mucispirillum schaedleri]MCX4360175.1 lysine--tRNA ligase [Mucispirillum schaedleri]USF23158.1 Lysine--tRNA ligase, heat inducible [Mucispirillum schaedleri ASF457]SIW04857.1 lysine tRNA synthetase, inducible [Mucispirillum schaedleri ASF457]